MSLFKPLAMKGEWDRGLAGVRSLLTEGATKEEDDREVKKTQQHSRRNGWIDPERGMKGIEGRYADR